MALACAGSVMSPTAAVAMPASRRILRGKANLKTGSGGNLRVGHHPARRRIDQIHAVLAQFFRKLHRFVGIPAAVGPVGSGDADKQRQTLRPHAANGIHHLEHQPDAIVEAAAVCIGALICQRRQKLMKQIAVRRMNLNEIEAGLKRPARSLAKALDHRPNSGFVERRRHGVIRRKSDCAGRDRLPSAI